MKLSKLLYFGDFVATPVAILILAWLGLAGRDAGATLWWLLALFAGLFAWTFIEYVVHRWVYHQIPFFEAYHDAHHDDPDGLVGAPSFIAIAVILVLFVLPILPAGLLVATGFGSGVLLGYIAYMAVHHLSHHLQPKPGSLLYGARIRHMAHHFHRVPGNYGIITPFWDHVFSTYVGGPRKASA
jgi:sterol desaturase/sphingolipid hydroxylase (fatty acid hydroxylase superfamily)